MSGAKETPRQKMIGMMYLVLTALLALNVSVEVLDAFKIVNEGLETTYTSVDSKINDYYKTFEQQYNKNPEKTENHWKKAQEIRTKTDEIINYIETDVKLALLLLNNETTLEGLLNPETEEERLILNPDQIDPKKNRRVFHKVNFSEKALAQRDKYDNVNLFMIEQGKASELREKIEQYRNYIINSVESVGITDYDKHVGLITNAEYKEADGTPSTWERSHFDHVIIPGAISVLNEIVSEIQTTEYDAIAELFKNVDAGDFKFNTLEAKVFPKTTYVLQGQDYEADVFIIASDNTKEFDAKYARGVKELSKASANAIQKISSKNGVVKIKVPTSAEGEQNIAGAIEMKNPLTGAVELYPFHTSYTVAPPSANVNPTKMNVMYIGLENPIAISAPGFTKEQISLDVTNGELIKGANGELLVKPGDEGTITTVTVSTTIDGKKVILDNCDFRLKRVPDPKPILNGKTSGKFSKNLLQNMDGFFVTMGEDFDFEGFNFEVLSYDAVTFVSGDTRGVRGVTGRLFDNRVKDLMKSARSGQRISIENIKVKGPDGKERLLETPITITVE